MASLPLHPVDRIHLPVCSSKQLSSLTHISNEDETQLLSSAMNVSAARRIHTHSERRHHSTHAHSSSASCAKPLQRRRQSLVKQSLRVQARRMVGKLTDWDLKTPPARAPAPITFSRSSSPRMLYAMVSNKENIIPRQPMELPRFGPCLPAFPDAVSTTGNQSCARQQGSHSRSAVRRRARNGRKAMRAARPHQ
eukprot:scaffold137882_cov32-Tisochrysis_lutea.AAC.1